MFVYDSGLVISKLFKNNISRFTPVAKKKKKKNQQQHALALRHKDTPCFFNGFSVRLMTRSETTQPQGRGDDIINN